MAETTSATMALTQPVAQDFAEGGKQAQVHLLEPVRSDSFTSSQGFAPRPRTDSHHLATLKPPSRKWLIVQARIWRFLMGIGMHFHDLNNPRPPKPAFVKHIPTLPRGSEPGLALFLHATRLQLSHSYWPQIPGRRQLSWWWLRPGHCS